MAYAQPEIDAVPEHNRAAPARRRRKVIIGVSCLLGIVVVGAASIITMLDRLEMRNASFRPPMTSLEREQLLPPEPVLEIKPQVEGLRYGADVLPARQGAGGEAAALDTAPPSAAVLLLIPPTLGVPPNVEPRSGKPLGIAQAVHVHNGAQ
jgi:hypothetical protein